MGETEKTLILPPGLMPGIKESRQPNLCRKEYIEREKELFHIEVGKYSWGMGWGHGVISNAFIFHEV